MNITDFMLVEDVVTTYLDLAFTDNNLFLIKYRSRWMGSDERKYRITGIYEKVSKNYYHLESIDNVGFRFIVFDEVQQYSKYDSHLVDMSMLVTLPSFNSILTMVSFKDKYKGLEYYTLASNEVCNTYNTRSIKPVEFSENHEFTDDELSNLKEFESHMPPWGQSIVKKN